MKGKDVASTRPLRYTPEQERARAQAFAQRDGFATGFVRGYQVKAGGGVSFGQLAQGRAEAKERYPIFASQRRVVQCDGKGYCLSEDGTHILVADANGGWQKAHGVYSREWILFLDELLLHPDIIVRTNE